MSLPIADQEVKVMRPIALQLEWRWRGTERGKRELHRTEAPQILPGD